MNRFGHAVLAIVVVWELYRIYSKTCTHTRDWEIVPSKHNIQLTEHNYQVALKDPAREVITHLYINSLITTRNVSS